MAQIIVVTSAKGGTGKSTVSASMGLALALRGHRTVVVEFDTGLRTLDLLLGCDRRIVFDMNNVIENEADLNDALVRDKRSDQLYLLAASQTRDKNSLTKNGVSKLFDKLQKAGFDYIICDSPPGIDRGARIALYFADTAIVVTTPDPVAVRAADRMLGLLQTETRRAKNSLSPATEHLLINRIRKSDVADGWQLPGSEVSDMLGINTLAVVPECPYVQQACAQGTPVVLNEESAAGRALSFAVAYLVGDKSAVRPANTDTDRETDKKPAGKLLGRLFNRQ